MIDQEEYLLLMKLNDIDKYNEIKKEKDKNNNKNKYGEYCEEEKKNNNFVDVVTAPLSDDNYDNMEINETCKIFFNDDF